ncbi:helix-turn-helix transcriptional regulator [Variovorax sp. W6]|uniref:helix-turn-helix transcriptional regulator n=1 Tax=Variovorax sp. W6 TaxID=3093895 RepID=UPI003D800E98
MDLVIAAKSLALMRRPKVLALTGWSKSTLANRVDAGDFPAPVPTGPRTVAWVEAEVAAWLEARISERNARLEKQKAFDQNTQSMRGAQA